MIGATGPKISSLQQARVVGDVAQHRRRVEVAGAVRALAAHQRVAPLVTASSTSSLTFERWSSLISGPTSHALLGAAAHLQRAHPLGQRLGEVARHRLRDVEAVGGGARLADVAHLRDHRALDRGVEVGVVEDHERRIAAELHRHPQHLLGRLLQQRAADLGRAREAQLAQPEVRDDRLRHLARARAGDHVQDSARQARLLEDLRDGQRAQRSQPAGFSTIVHPAATAGPILRVAIAAGKFQGVIMYAGPTGCFITSSLP